jgi:hypothetical protein
MEPCNARYVYQNGAACLHHCLTTPGCVQFTWAPLNGDQNWPGKKVCTIYNSAILGWNQIWAPNQVMCKPIQLLNPSVLKCPPNSRQIGTVNADIAGCGLEACNARYNVPNIVACEQKCRANPACKSFSWAPKYGSQYDLQYQVCTIYGTSVQNNIWGPQQILCYPIRNDEAPEYHEGYNERASHRREEYNERNEERSEVVNGRREEGNERNRETGESRRVSAEERREGVGARNEEIGERNEEGREAVSARNEERLESDSVSPIVEARERAARVVDTRNDHIRDGNERRARGVDTRRDNYGNRADARRDNLQDVRERRGRNNEAKRDATIDRNERVARGRDNGADVRDTDRDQSDSA